MKVEEAKINGVFKITPKIFSDERGHFIESYNEESLRPFIGDTKFVQDNHSFSKKGVLRGLHFQNGPHAQGKLVRVAKGKVIDVVVDINPESPTFGQHEKFILDGEHYEMIYLPNTMAHGFIALEDTIFTYKCTNFYNVESESGIIWNDKDLNIDWEIKSPLISSKDQELPQFKSLFRS